MRIDLEHRRSMDKDGILELLARAEVGHMATSRRVRSAIRSTRPFRL